MPLLLLLPDLRLLDCCEPELCLPVMVTYSLLSFADASFNFMLKFDRCNTQYAIVPVEHLINEIECTTTPLLDGMGCSKIKLKEVSSTADELFFQLQFPW